MMQGSGRAVIRLLFKCNDTWVFPVEKGKTRGVPCGASSSGEAHTSGGIMALEP
jgi:hypothetical protein